MIIDFHTHVYPEKAARKFFAIVNKTTGMVPCTDGTITGLTKSMLDNHIDYSVVLPVITNPVQFISLNNYAAAINKINGIISFGGVHPLSNNIKDELREIKALGLKGIKIHPDYQKTYIDDPKMVSLIDAAADLGLIIVIHAGIDVGLTNNVCCPPDRCLNMLNKIDYPNIVLAHIGGWKLWDEVENYLTGKNIYFDLSFSLGVIPGEQFLRIIKQHGADKLLYGSDSPWEIQINAYNFIEKMELSIEDKNLIYYENARKLLNI